MEYMAARDLRSSKDVWEKLAQKGELVLTNNGKPTALIIEVDSSSLEETVAAFRQAKAMRLTNEMRLDALRSGVSGMSVEEINAEIEAVRQDSAAGQADNG